MGDAHLLILVGGDGGEHRLGKGEGVAALQVHQGLQEVACHVVVASRIR